jgi:glycine cleavage system H protein
MPAGDAFLQFQRAKFKTKLPQDQLYTQSHMWLREGTPGVWQIGLTRFALRMLGDPVELELEVKPGAAIETGRVVGWLEGFKAVSDLYTPMDGEFAGGNPELDADLDVVKSSSYDRGWLFAMRGTPSDECLDAEGYADFLGSTIDRMLGEEEQRRQS